MLLKITLKTQERALRAFLGASNGSWQETLQFLWQQYCAAFVNANEFVKEMLIDKIIHARVFCIGGPKRGSKGIFHNMFLEIWKVKKYMAQKANISKSIRHQKDLGRVATERRQQEP